MHVSRSSAVRLQRLGELLSFGVVLDRFDQSSHDAIEDLAGRFTREGGGQNAIDGLAEIEQLQEPRGELVRLAGPGRSANHDVIRGPCVGLRCQDFQTNASEMPVLPA